MNGRGAVRKSPIDESESNGSMPRLSLMMPIDEMVCHFGITVYHYYLSVMIASERAPVQIQIQSTNSLTLNPHSAGWLEGFSYGFTMFAYRELIG